MEILKLKIQLCQTEMDLMRSQSQVLQLQYDRNERLLAEMQDELAALQDAEDEVGEIITPDDVVLAQSAQ
jgi:hypothetical protein